jgi:hypothetical protein
MMAARCGATSIAADGWIGIADQPMAATVVRQMTPGLLVPRDDDVASITKVTGKACEALTNRKNSGRRVAGRIAGCGGRGDHFPRLWVPQGDVACAALGPCCDVDSRCIRQPDDPIGLSCENLTPCSPTVVLRAPGAPEKAMCGEVDSYVGRGLYGRPTVSPDPERWLAAASVHNKKCASGDAHFALFPLDSGHGPNTHTHCETSSPRPRPRGSRQPYR